MPVNSLLDLNPDKLFEEHSVFEIQEIQKRLQTEIDRKREELRTIVGERYRDLIEAADTIADMKVTAEGIVSHIDNMTSKCKQLEEQQLLGFTPASHVKRTSHRSDFYSVAVQIRILITIPENIWIALDEEDYLLAAQLFLFARHLNTGLQLQSGGNSGLSGREIEHLFPVVLHQWSTISDFLPMIIQKCEEKIQLQDVSFEDVSRSLCAFALLEGLDTQQLIARFLDLRTQALRTIFKADNQSSVKACVLDSVTLLVQTFSLLQACFVGDIEGGLMHEGLIYQTLKTIVGKEAPPSLDLIPLRDCIGLKLLPSVISDFRPSVQQQVEPLLPGSVKEILSAWVDTTKEYITQEVNNLLKFLRTLRGLAAVRAAHEAVPPGHATVCRLLLVPHATDLWGTFFRPSLSSRAHSVVKQQWYSALQRVKSAVTTTLNNMNDPTFLKVNKPEEDLRWFVWKEWDTDLPQSDHPTQNPRGLLMKAKGYSPRVEKLCSEFDHELEELLKDLNHYIEDPDGTSITKNFSESSEEHSDRKQLQAHLQKCSLENMKLLVNYVQEKQSDDCEGSALLLARFLQAICDLCPHVQQCLMPQNYRMPFHKLDTPLELTPWQEVCNISKQGSLLLWNHWREGMSKRIQDMVAKKLCFPTDLEKLINLIPQWDVLAIEEEGEGGHKIQSNIRVPSQPSLSLQDTLYAVCFEINAVVPHTLPRKIHQDLVECIIGYIFEFYKSTTNTKPLSQSQALQFLLDVKYLTLLLVPRDNKILISTSQELSEKMEREIDPFDLDVFSPYIQNNIKRSVQRTQGLLGVLIAWPEKLCHAASVRSQGAGGSAISVQGGSIDDPSVLPTAAAPQWFPLLPITGQAAGSRLSTTMSQGGSGAVSAAVQQEEKPQVKKTSGLKQKPDASAGDIVRSGAAAFFGAMSTDWFG